MRLLVWRNVATLHDYTLREFECTYNFTINKDFRGFLLDHNGGFPAPGVFPTVVRERKLERFLDFNDKTSDKGAWELNKRLRHDIGPKRIIVGLEKKGNFVCLERHYSHQEIVVWSHVSGEFEKCLLDIPAFLRIFN